MQILEGTIGGPGWSLTLKRRRQYGNPMHVRFQGTGIVSGEKWIYDYEGYLVPHWPNGVDQRPAIVGSVIRTIPHAGRPARHGRAGRRRVLVLRGTGRVDRWLGSRSISTC